MSLLALGLNVHTPLPRTRPRERYLSLRSLRIHIIKKTRQYLFVNILCSIRVRCVVDDWYFDIPIDNVRNRERERINESPCPPFLLRHTSHLKLIIVNLTSNTLDLRASGPMTIDRIVIIIVFLRQLEFCSMFWRDTDENILFSFLSNTTWSTWQIKIRSKKIQKSKTHKRLKIKTQ